MQSASCSSGGAAASLAHQDSAVLARTIHVLAAELERERLASAQVTAMLASLLQQQPQQPAGLAAFGPAGCGTDQAAAAAPQVLLPQKSLEQMLSRELLEALAPSYQRSLQLGAGGLAPAAPGAGALW